MKFYVNYIIIVYISLFASNQAFCAVEKKPMYPNHYIADAQRTLFEKASDLLQGESETFFSQVGEDAILASVFAKEVGEGILY